MKYPAVHPALTTNQPKTRKLVSVAGALTVMGTALAIPVFAASAAGATTDVSAATPVTFTLTAGALAISAPTIGVSLGSQPASTTSSTISGPLGLVTVTDLRGGATTWTASVISTAFTPTAGPADPASNVSYAAGTITPLGLVVGTAVAAPNLTGVSTVVTGVSTGISAATWDPTVSVVVPASFAVGTYTATITHSVA
jgi:hypothetical protein